jgi:hypothetical protein
MTAQNVPRDLRKAGVTELRISLATAGWLASGRGWLLHAAELNVLREHLHDRHSRPTTQTDPRPIHNHLFSIFFERS